MTTATRWRKGTTPRIIPYVTEEELCRYVSKRFGIAAADHDGFLRAARKLCRTVERLARLGDRDAILRLVNEIKRNGLAD
jgi:hypothetical protein